jgi:hypothetical protein
MRPRAFQLSLFGFAALLGACGEEKICTDEPRLAIRVYVTSPEGLPIDRVTVQLTHEIECSLSSTPHDAGSDRMYRCREQGGGVYTVRVYSGDEVWNAAVHIDANECHTTEIKDVGVVLDPNDHGDHDLGSDEDDDMDEVDES